MFRELEKWFSPHCFWVWAASVHQLAMSKEIPTQTQRRASASTEHRGTGQWQSPSGQAWRSSWGGWPVQRCVHLCRAQKQSSHWMFVRWFEMVSVSLLYDLSHILMSHLSSLRKPIILDLKTLTTGYQVTSEQWHWTHSCSQSLQTHKAKQNPLRLWIGRYQPGGNGASIMVGRMNLGKIFGFNAC